MLTELTDQVLGAVRRIDPDIPSEHLRFSARADNEWYHPYTSSPDCPSAAYRELSVAELNTLTWCERCDIDTTSTTTRVSRLIADLSNHDLVEVLQAIENLATVGRAHPTINDLAANFTNAVEAAYLVQELAAHLRQELSSYSSMQVYSMNPYASFVTPHSDDALARLRALYEDAATDPKINVLFEQYARERVSGIVVDDSRSVIASSHDLAQYLSAEDDLFGNLTGDVALGDAAVACSLRVLHSGWDQHGSIAALSLPDWVIEVIGNVAPRALLSKRHTGLDQKVVEIANTLWDPYGSGVVASFDDCVEAAQAVLRRRVSETM